MPFLDPKSPWTFQHCDLITPVIDLFGKAFLWAQHGCRAGQGASGWEISKFRPTTAEVDGGGSVETESIHEYRFTNGLKLLTMLESSNNYTLVNQMNCQICVQPKLRNDQKNVSTPAVERVRGPGVQKRTALVPWQPWIENVHTMAVACKNTQTNARTPPKHPSKKWKNSWIHWKWTISIKTLLLCWGLGGVSEATLRVLNPTNSKLFNKMMMKHYAETPQKSM